MKGDTIICPPVSLHWRVFHTNRYPCSVGRGASSAARGWKRNELPGRQQADALHRQRPWRQIRPQKTPSSVGIWAHPRQLRGGALGTASVAGTSLPGKLSPRRPTRSKRVNIRRTRQCQTKTGDNVRSFSNSKFFLAETEKLVQKINTKIKKQRKFSQNKTKQNMTFSLKKAEQLGCVPPSLQRGWSTTNPSFRW